MDILERYVAIDDKCAWPNLTLMPDGSITAYYCERVPIAPAVSHGRRAVASVRL